MLHVTTRSKVTGRKLAELDVRIETTIAQLRHLIYRSGMSELERGFAYSYHLFCGDTRLCDDRLRLDDLAGGQALIDIIVLRCMFPAVMTIREEDIAPGPAIEEVQGKRGHPACSEMICVGHRNCKLVWPVTVRRISVCTDIGMSYGKNVNTIFKWFRLW